MAVSVGAGERLALRASVVPGYRVLAVGRIRLRLFRRTVVVCAVLLVALLLVGLLSAGLGEVRVGPAGLWDALTGGGTMLQRYTVLRLRLPRFLSALLVGAALGASGAIFQSLSRNALGSPDFLGFTAGSSVGAMVALLVLGSSVASTAGGAIVGGLLAATGVYALARRESGDGGHTDDRLIYIGIGANAMLLAVISYLLARSELVAAQGAYVWLIGSLGGASWGTVTFLGLVLLALAPVALLAGRRLAYLEMGDDAAHALGVDVDRSRLTLIAVGAALAGVAVSMAGPIAFVALAAPQLAKRLTRAAGPNTVAAALMGGLLLGVGDLLARGVPGQLPVGVLTGMLGGVYLAWLLGRQWGRETA